MCGIAGLLLPGGETPTREVLGAMAASLAHRGPDGEGVYVGAGVGFAHRRLAIVDLAGGAQPMHSADGRVHVTFNGEIYNYRALRAELERDGYRFLTDSDTEVIVHGYAAWGEALPSHLSGMFAFAVYDSLHRSAFIARDRMGQKPFYYAHQRDGSLVFGSELRAVLASGRIERRIDRHAAALFFTYDYVPHPHTIIEGVRKLAPGATLTWCDGTLHEGRYYAVPFVAGGAPVDDDVESFRGLRRAIVGATERHLMSDVPLGVFVSGGVDSSVILASVRAAEPDRAIEAFSIGFDEPSFDETRWARLAARHFRAQHFHQTLSVAKLFDVLPQVARHLDEPFADPSVVPTWMLARFTRQHVKVALSGDGGDELFLGYDTFRAHELVLTLRRVLGGVGEQAALRVARAVAALMPVRHENMSIEFKLARLARGLSQPDEVMHAAWLAPALPGARDDFVARALRREVPFAAAFAFAREAWNGCRDDDPLQRASHQYLCTYMAEGILTKVDRASMAHGLEVRAPLLDPEVVRIAVQTGAAYKLRNGVAKYNLKRAFRADLPHEIVSRAKKGFGIPVARWLCGPLRGELLRLTERGRLEASGVCEPAVVARLVDEHLRQRHDHRKPLWALMMFEYWRENWLNGANA